MCTANPNDGDIRLVGGGVSYEGRLEYYNDGVWGTISNYFWNVLDTAVACNQLGHPREGEFNTT